MGLTHEIILMQKLKALVLASIGIGKTHRTSADPGIAFTVQLFIHFDFLM
jgi:hypothetical protein